MDDTGDQSRRDNPYANLKDLLDALSRSGFHDSRRVIAEANRDYPIRTVRPYSLRRSILALAICSNITEHVLSHIILIIFGTKHAQSRHKACVTIIALIHTDLRSIVHLLSLGYDVQARNLLRSLRERIDVFACCALSNPYSEAFIAADSLEKVNKFWFTHVRKGKAQAYWSSRFSALTGAEQGLFEQYWAEWRKEAEAVLHASEHVFHGEGFFAIFPGTGVRRNKLGINGLPGRMSLWTVQTGVNFLWELLMTCRVAFNELRDGTLEVTGENDRALLATINTEFPKHSSFLMQTYAAYSGMDWLASEEAAEDLNS